MKSKKLPSWYHAERLTRAGISFPDRRAARKAIRKSDKLDKVRRSWIVFELRPGKIIAVQGKPLEKHERTKDRFQMHLTT